MSVVAASRLVFAVARDGVLPFSRWIGQVDEQRQPRNAVTVMFIFGAALLCTILPSAVAFTSLTSAGGIPTTAAYGLIAVLRLTMTPNDFKNSHFFLGKWRRPAYIATALFNGLVFAVSLLTCFPTMADNLMPIHLTDPGLAFLLPCYCAELQLRTSIFGYMIDPCLTHDCQRLLSSSVPSQSSVSSAGTSYRPRSGSVASKFCERSRSQTKSHSTQTALPSRATLPEMPDTA